MKGSLIRIVNKLIIAGFLAGSCLPSFSKPTEIFPAMSDSMVNALMNSALPGDTLLFYPGTYQGPYRLQGVHGKVNMPVVIFGATGLGDGSTVINGHSAPGMFLNNHAFFLRNCSWITIERFTIKNCWTDLIRVEDVSYLSVKRCIMYGGKRALFATGRESHHFLIEDCSWEQEERVWTHADDFSWDEIHHGIHRYYNGSLFQGSGISGVFVLRDNHIRNTFNAFRLSQINDGEFDRLACSNGEIYRNTIVNTSDNVLEPEVSVHNLHYYHNRMINAHAFISVTEVTGGPIYLYGNTAVSLPGSGDGWTVFKISSRERVLTSPIYIFNNSWYVDFDIVGSPQNVWSNDHVVYFNNASFMAVNDTFGIYNIGQHNIFDFNCSNLPFPGWFTDMGFEKNGIVRDPLFIDPFENDFRLKEHSPCIDRGMNAEDLIIAYDGAAPDIGAYENGRLIEGQPFRFMKPQEEVPFEEHPRITRHKLTGERITLWFSDPVDWGSVSGINFQVRINETPISVRETELSDDHYCLTLTAEKEFPEGNAELILSHWPLGENGMPVTGWASTLPVRIQ